MNEKFNLFRKTIPNEIKKAEEWLTETKNRPLSLFWFMFKAKNNFLAWLWIRLISAGLKPAVRQTKNVSFYMNISQKK